MIAAATAVRRLGTAPAWVAAAMLAACAPAIEAPGPAPEAVAPTPVSASPPRRPRLPGPTQADLRRARAEAARAAPATSDSSAVMTGYLQRIEDRLVARGLLATDRASDVALTPEQLVEDFDRIALRDEYAGLGAQSAGSAAPPAPLRRWAGEVRMQLVFGASVPPQVRAGDRQTVAALAERLARASGHPVRAVAEGGNFIVAVTSQDDAVALAPQVGALVPGLPSGDLAALSRLAPQTFCTAFAYGRGGGPETVNAVALIRAELPPRLRAACFEEELAQGLGLPNDSATARPSVFNDDEAQALLTRHDELLLAMLYDPRLRPGMTGAEARPIAAAIAAELLGAPAASAAVQPPPADPAAAAAGTPLAATTSPIPAGP